MRQIIPRLAKSKRGATAIEYGLMAALVAIAIITGVSSVASETTTMWGHVEQKVVEVVQD